MLYGLMNYIDFFYLKSIIFDSIGLKNNDSYTLIVK